LPQKITTQQQVSTTPTLVTFIHQSWTLEQHHHQHTNGTPSSLFAQLRALPPVVSAFLHNPAAPLRPSSLSLLFLLSPRLPQVLFSSTAPSTTMPRPSHPQQDGTQHQPYDVDGGSCPPDDANAVDVGQTELLLGTDLEPALNSFPETDEADTGAETARQVLSPLAVAQIAVPQPANVRSPRSVGGIVNTSTARSVHPLQKTKIILKLARPGVNQENQRPPLRKPLSHRRRRGIQKVRSLVPPHKNCSVGCGGPGGRFSVGKLPRGVTPPRAAARDGSIAHGDAMLSIARGVQHVQSCSGCDRSLCQSTRTLVRRCAHHVRQCSLLSCRDCQACNVSRMVQIAWQSGNESDRVGICAK